MRIMRVLPRRLARQAVAAYREAHPPVSVEAQTPGERAAAVLDQIATWDQQRQAAEDLSERTDIEQRLTHQLALVEMLDAYGQDWVEQMLQHAIRLQAERTR